MQQVDELINSVLCNESYHRRLVPSIAINNDEVEQVVASAFVKRGVKCSQDMNLVQWSPSSAGMKDSDTSVKFPSSRGSLLPTAALVKANSSGVSLLT